MLSWSLWEKKVAEMQPKEVKADPPNEGVSWLLVPSDVVWAANFNQAWSHSLWTFLYETNRLPYLHEFLGLYFLIVTKMQITNTKNQSSQLYLLCIV